MANLAKFRNNNSKSSQYVNARYELNTKKTSQPL